MNSRHRGLGAMSLIAGAALALSACTSTGLTNPKPADSTAVVTSAATSTPSPTFVPSFPPAPAPAHAASAASLKANFGSGCAGTRSGMPATRYRATIGDVDGDGRKDTEWATIPRGGFIEFGVTTASGTTIATTLGFASGGERSVSIGALSTGQTVALPTDLHGAPLYVIHDCRWVETKFTSAPEGTFVTSYYDPPEDGGGCVGRRLYQVDSTQPSKDHATVTGITEHISADGRTVTAGKQITFLQNVNTNNTSLKTLAKYGSGNCGPSARLIPSYHPS